MKNILLIDTDILIDTARKDNVAINRLKIAEKHSILHICSITQMELIVGCRNRNELRVLNKFLSRFVIINITDNISENAVDLLRKYRLSHGLLIPDALIAATALNLSLPFLSKNQKDYRFIEGLELLPYP